MQRLLIEYELSLFIIGLLSIKNKEEKLTTKKISIHETLSWFLSPNRFPVFLFLITFITYGIFLPFLGFYGDDFSYAWLAYRVGSVDAFFSGNRPLLGQIFLFVSKVIPPSILAWHLLVIFLRSGLAILVFCLFHSFDRLDHRTPYLVSLLFLVYPGALIYYHPVTFTFVFTSIIFLVFSFWLTILNLGHTRNRWLVTATSLLFSSLNLLIHEYFFFLEILRPFFIWLALEEKDKGKRFKRALFEALPYLVLFAAISLYRMSGSGSVSHYEPVLINDFLQNPVTATGKYIPLFAADLINFGLQVWLKIFQPQAFMQQQGMVTSIIYLSLVAVSALCVYLFLSRLDNKFSASRSTKNFKSALALIVIGIVALLLAALPPRIAGITNSVGVGIENRFSLSFALGAVMILAGLFLLVNKLRLANILLALLCAFSIGQHFFVANQFRYEWIEQKRFYWQLAWRFPTLPVPTTIIADYRALQKVAENPLSATINWMYFHEAYGRTQNQAGYYLFYNEDRLKEWLNDLNQPLPPMRTGLIGISSYLQFHLLAMENYQGCLRVLDPLTASLDESLPAYLKKAAAISDLNREYLEDQAHPAIMDANIFGAEPPHEWCYYFQKADLARTRSQWSEMLRLKSEAAQRGFFPQDAHEKMIFLYAFIGSGDYQSALVLSRELTADKAYFSPMICRIWENAALEMPDIPAEVSKLYQTEFACS